MGAPSVRPEVLGRLLVTPSLLEVLPDTGAIAVFLEAALHEVPGFHTLMICTEEAVYARQRTQETGNHSQLTLPSVATGESVPTGCFLQSESDAIARYAIALATAHHRYGYLMLDIDDPEQFSPYLPYIHNLANVIATVLENRAFVRFEATLRKIAEKVRDSLDAEQILQRAVTELAIALGISYCDAVVYGHATPACVIRYQASLAEEAIHQSQLLEWANAPLLRQQLQSRPGCYPFCQLEFPAFAILVCPIFDDQVESVGILGDLWLFKSAHLGFSPIEIDLVQQVAGQCAIALRQARLYQATQDQVEVLKRLNQLKDDFLSTTSHELRTPITQMKMVLHLLKTLVHPPQTATEVTAVDSAASQANIVLPKAKVWQYLTILQEACDRELALVEDLLNLQTLEAGTFMTQMSTFNLSEVLPQWLEPFQTRTQLQHQTLQVHIADNLPPLQLDPCALKRVVSELLTNACKYTPTGETIAIGVEMVPATLAPTTLAPTTIASTTIAPTTIAPTTIAPTGSLATESLTTGSLTTGSLTTGSLTTGSLTTGQTTATTASETPCLRITVTNTGVEIAPMELPYLFEKFYRVPNHDPWQQGGTGLGLALIKGLVEKMHGTIRVESSHNQTCFTVCLSLSKSGQVTCDS